MIRDLCNCYKTLQIIRWGTLYWICTLDFVPVVDDEPRLLPLEVEVELEGEGECDVVDLAHLEHHDVHVDVQRLAALRGDEVLLRSFDGGMVQ